MNQSESFVDGNIGLDRSAINHHGQIQLADQDSPNSSPSTNSQSSPPHRTIRNSFDERRHDTAIKIRKVLHISKPSDDHSDLTSSILAHDTTEPSKSRLEHAIPVPDKLTVKDLIHNPVDTVKDKIHGQGSHQAAANIAAKEISHGHQVNIVNAHDRVKHAETETERLLALKDLDKLMKERQTMYVRWTVDRHVTKCRVLPRETFARKSRSAFESKTIHGETVVDWNAYGTYASNLFSSSHALCADIFQQLEYYAQQYGGQYIGFGSDPPAPSKESIMPNVERTIIASAPFQEFIMTTRRVYRWEDSVETSKYLVIYLLLWYFNLLLPGMLSAVVYLVVHRHFYGDTLEDVRRDLQRTEDTHQTALSLTEFIEKEGDELWTEKILQDLGPWLMVQLCDVANMCEVMRNFYEWRVPSRTMATLAVFLVAIIFTTFAPAWLLIKSATFGAGVTFFGLFPLASKFPDYRLLASIPKRIFWNIPTHAEWAFKSLQAEGSRYQHSTQPEGQHSENLDYGFYTGHHNGDRGRLIISAFSIRFETNVGHRVMWTLNYDQITSLEKVERIASKNFSKNDSGKDLRIVSKQAEEHEWMLVNVTGRDQAFSQIVGFSNTKWQIVW